MKITSKRLLLLFALLRFVACDQEHAKKRLEIPSTDAPEIASTFTSQKNEKPETTSTGSFQKEYSQPLNQPTNNEKEVAETPEDKTEVKTPDDLKFPDKKSPKNSFGNRSIKPGAPAAVHDRPVISVTPPSTKTLAPILLPNPFYQNEIMSEAFEEFDQIHMPDYEISGKEMKVLLEKDRIDLDTQAKLANTFLAVLENTEPKFVEKISLEDRLQIVFELAENPVMLKYMLESNNKLAESIQTKNPDFALTDVEKRASTPFLYAAYLHSIFMNQEHFMSPAVYISTDSFDCKRYRILTFGMIDFSEKKGIKVFTEMNQSSKNFMLQINDIFKAYLASSYKDSNVALKIMGHADPEPTTKAKFNERAGLQRVTLTKQQISAAFPELKDIEIVSLGDRLPLTTDPVYKLKNRRVEFVLMQTEIEAETTQTDD